MDCTEYKKIIQTKPITKKWNETKLLNHFAVYIYFEPKIVSYVNKTSMSKHIREQPKRLITFF